MKGPQTTNQTGGHANPPKKNNRGKAPVTDRIGLRVEVQEPVKFSRSQKRRLERATFEDANKASYPRGKHIRLKMMVLYLGGHASTLWVAPIIKLTSCTTEPGVLVSLERGTFKTRSLTVRVPT